MAWLIARELEVQGLLFDTDALQSKPDKEMRPVVDCVQECLQLITLEIVGKGMRV